MSQVLTEGLSHARPGLALEFGVADGATLRKIAAERPGETFGFDSFDGLPEDWRRGFARGKFACDPPDVPGATLVVGLFQHTLPTWLDGHPTDSIGLVHIDCDLYSSTSFVLTTLGKLQPGTVIVFDELTGYPGWQHHEHKALLEWVAATGATLRPLGSEGEVAAFQVQ